ncbi:MAG: PTS system mannose/fructose/sorbose family transporter subunit IID [Chloroflexi bacterium]|nr:PTS system mannose/fructose/sorbose family transporter subunit IID [Chloroflexota bacterium]
MATNETKITRADLMKSFWRYVWLFQCGWNYERMQSVGYAYSILPILKKTRPGEEEFKEAFLTNLNFFNTNPVVGAPLIIGAHIALEEAGASLETTEGLKVGLMGPLAGVGDTLVWALYNSIIFSIGASMALSGSALGPILVLLLVFFPYLAVRYWQFTWAYKQGVNLVTQLGGGIIAKITEFATIVGLIVIGGFAPSIVNLKVAWKPAIAATVQGEAVSQVIDIQAQLDAILPYMLPVLVTALAYWLLKKGWSPVAVLALLFVIGFIGGAIGLFG